MTQTPDFYDDLALSLKTAKQLVADGALNRQTAAHHPVIGSVDEHGNPHQRVMILRQVDWTSRLLRLHTDMRTDKITQLKNNGFVSAIIYDEPAKLQIRMSGIASIASDDIRDAAWNSSTTFARRCYMAEGAPGASSTFPTSGLPRWIEGKQPDEAQLASARSNFAVLLIKVDRIEWLYLANAGHRRARWCWDDADQKWSGTWLIP